MPLLRTSRATFGQRIAIGIVWLTGLLLLAGLIVFGFFIGVAVLGLAMIAGLVGWLRWRFGHSIEPVARGGERAKLPGATILDAEYVVIRREER